MSNSTDLASQCLSAAERSLKSLKEPYTTDQLAREAEQLFSRMSRLGPAPITLVIEKGHDVP
jgi:hypothetical protein